MDPRLFNSLQSHIQRAVVQSAKPRCSFQRTKCLWILYRTDRYLALRMRTRKTRRNRLDMGWFRPFSAKSGPISHLFAFSSQCMSTPRSRAEQPDGLALCCHPFPSPPTVIRCPRSNSFPWSYFRTFFHSVIGKTPRPNLGFQRIRCHWPRLGGATETPLPLIIPVIPSPFTVATPQSGSVSARIQATTRFRVSTAVRRCARRDLDEECGGIVRWAKSRGVESNGLIFRCARVRLNVGRIWT